MVEIWDHYLFCGFVDPLLMLPSFVHCFGNALFEEHLLEILILLLKGDWASF